jgi:excisionase family DNA binding protein
MARKLPAPIPRYSLTPAEAAASLGVGVDMFNAEIRPELRLIRRGRKVLIPVSELERWLVENAERPLAETVAA